MDGKIYPVRFDFRTGLRIFQAWEDEDLTEEEKAGITLGNVYLTTPDNEQAAFEQAVKFLNCGKELHVDEGKRTPERLYSLVQDADLIYSAFHQTHGIDLEAAEMHWWKFWALLMDLGNETRFCQVIATRYAVSHGQATDWQKKDYLEHPEVYKLSQPDTSTPDEKEKKALFEKLLAEGRAKRHGK